MVMYQHIALPKVSSQSYDMPLYSLAITSAKVMQTSTVDLTRQQVMTQTITPAKNIQNCEKVSTISLSTRTCKSNKTNLQISFRQSIKSVILTSCLFASLTVASLYPLSAHASILDPILRLIPFTDSTKEEETSDEVTDNTETQNTLQTPNLASIMYAEFAAHRGDINQALAIYKQEAFKEDSTSVFERALSLSLVYEPVEESLKFAQTWQLQHPEHVPAQFYVAHLALKANDYQLAGNILSQILQQDPQADLTEILQGIYPTSKVDQQRLLDTIESLPDHQNPSILVMRAGLMSQLGQPEMAYVTVSQALKIQPNNAPFITLKADIIKQLMPYQEVLAYISTERKRLKTNKTLYLYEIRYRLSLNQTKEAWNLLIEAHNLFHDDEMTLLAALVSLDLAEYTKADELLSGLASSPYYTDRAYYYLGISAERQQKFDKAKRFLSKVSQKDLVLEARQKLVYILMLENQPEHALEVLRKFSAQFEFYAPESALMQAEILRQLGRLDDAKKILADMNQRYPDNTKLLYAWVQLLDNQEESKLKHSLLDHLILLDPENPNYQIILAQLLFANGNEQDIEQSLEIAQSVLDIPYKSQFFSQDNYITALNILASNELLNHNYQKVVDYLEVIYDVSPNLDSGIILLRAYQGLDRNDKVTTLLSDLQNKFALGSTDINYRLQAY